LQSGENWGNSGTLGDIGEISGNEGTLGKIEEIRQIVENLGN
jgi:hypothetical protein